MHGGKDKENNGKNKWVEHEIKEEPEQTCGSIYLPDSLGAGRTRRRQIPIELYLTEDVN